MLLVLWIVAVVGSLLVFALSQNERVKIIGGIVFFCTFLTLCFAFWPGLRLPDGVR